MQNQLKNIPVFSMLSNSSLLLLAPHFKIIEMQKGDVLIKADNTEAYFYIIDEGIARAYSHGENQQITFWFGQKGDALFSYNSYINGKPGYENIELLEDCRLFRIKTKDLLSLYSTHIEIANWGRKIAEKELIATEKRLIDRLFKTATERYLEFLHQSPQLAKKVALKHIASYLGVTQVTLSRIRADIK
ncbi:Crp/Fnr family transcriptional regulator [Pedobacter punctiformis]|uniref:Crp/Fnr family transcriptional regulator n=1 Tax=Pedobacter punctiformis TaxID=3004097 RepID=A0ABT4L5C1_9SPHI|nr:Crp/Fnr family transcriptional regulator [Pedobacter sp. HCMS5-2]MCZ4243112.1 Crp/Fnr family transcriptional regulator [Pedobacter sp. HCMS5-2]